MTPAGASDGNPAAPAIASASTRITPELIDLHVRGAQRLRRQAMNAAVRGCAVGIFVLTRRSLRALQRRRRRCGRTLSAART